MLAEGRSGEVRTSTGTLKEVRLGPYAEGIVNDSGLGRYFEANRLGRAFMGTTTAAGFSVSNATFVAPLAATSTTLIGLFNPQGNTKAAVITRAVLGILPVGPATTTLEPVWVAATPNAGITAAAANMTFASTRLDAAAGTTMKGYANVVLTGLVNPIALGSFGGPAAGTTGALSTTALLVDETAGSIIVPPGAFVGVMATTLPVACTANGCLYFVEIDWPL